LVKPSPAPRPGGFTLVELLVVVAIISMLVSMLAPCLTQAKILANTTICNTNLHKIGRAMQMYAQDYNNFVPRDYWYGCRNPNSYDYGHYLYAAKLIGYLGESPFPTKYDDNDERIYDALEDMRVFKCPGVHDEEFALTYVVNGMDFKYYKMTGGYTSGAASSLDDLPDQPAKIFYVMEANIAMLDPHRFGLYDVLYPGNMPFQGDTPTEYPRAIRHDDMRHAGRTTMIFFDGHAETRDLHPDDLSISIFNPMAPK